ncbi:BCCT family transporter [Bacillus alveayuensis]|jgi:betaine/carnitine transporter, BCCT family|uniref:BCCT family transporter n=1 Tax=Aeribacillus alveayuensis TaxID=279215 RepID=UPI0005D122AE|nr:BCCT family transporter [Bacillus alveayuensis]
MKENKLIDWPTFIGALSLLLLVAVPLVLFPDQGETIVLAANSFITEKFGSLYLVLGFSVLIFLIYIAFSRFGTIKLGDAQVKPEFSTITWAAMLFCAGIGSSILYWGAIEWAYYYTSPPFGVEPKSKEAIQWAATYGIFHWGPIAWAIYCLPALPISYFYYVKKKPVLKISEACRPVIGKLTDGPIGKIIDVLFMFGLLGGAGTTLALGAPLIASGIQDLTGINPSMTLNTVILLICTLIFAMSAYSGLRKGIKVLSDINLWLASFFLIFVFAVGPTVFLAETTLNSVGFMLDHFFRMATWTEPFNDLGPFERTGFPESWTVFYWAWWLVYAPFVGLFVTKISRGRTIREMILGTLIYGTIGCLLFFGILGNFGLYLELTGQYSVTEVLNQQGAPAAIMGILSQLPLSKLIVAIFTVLAIIFLATTFDSSSYILASVVQKEVVDEPIRWNRLFWAFSLSILPLTLMYIGGLSTLQTASIVGGFPLIAITVLLSISFIKSVREHFIEEKRKDRIKEKKVS